MTKARDKAEVAATAGSTAAKPEPEARVPALDGVRGVAIALVLVYHFVFMSDAWASSSAIDRGIWRVAGAGWSGVDLFFVLSGFLITGILYDSRASAVQYFRSFYARRALRIFPLYFVFLLLIIVALPLIYADAEAASTAVWNDIEWYGTYSINIRTLFTGNFRAEGLYTGHLWSLAVEEQFYLMWPLVVLVLRRRALMGVCLGALVGALCVRTAFVLSGDDHGAAYTFTPARLDTLAVGALIALAARGDGRDVRVLARLARPIAVAAIAVLLALVVEQGDLAPPFGNWLLTVGFSAVALLYGVLLIAVLTSSPGSRLSDVFSNRVLRSLGRYSYAIYLFHLPVATVLARRTDLVQDMPELFGSTVPGIVLFGVLATAISYALAWVSWHVWEEQFLKLKTRFPYARPQPARLSA